MTEIVEVTFECGCVHMVETGVHGFRAFVWAGFLLHFLVGYDRAVRWTAMFTRRLTYAKVLDGHA